MRPNKTGQVANFNIRLPDENPNQHYVVLEIIEDDERLRADIKPLNTCLSFSPIKAVKLDNLQAVDVDTADLVGHNVTINNADYSQTTGKVIKVSEQKKLLDLIKGVKEVETNFWLTIEDENEKEQTGTLCVN